jgi:hypothetical protein
MDADGSKENIEAFFEVVWRAPAHSLRVPDYCTAASASFFRDAAPVLLDLRQSRAPTLVVNLPAWFRAMQKFCLVAMSSWSHNA